MSSATQEWMHGSIERLAAQRERYALAYRAAPSIDARERHRRNVNRLDEEIESLSEALYSVSTDMPSTPKYEQPPALGQQSVVDVAITGRYASLLDGGSLARDWAALLLWTLSAFAVGFAVIMFVV